MNQAGFGEIWNSWDDHHWNGMWANRPQMHGMIARLALSSPIQIPGKPKPKGCRSLWPRRKKRQAPLDISIVEVGGGYGHMMRMLRDKGHTGSYTSIDISEGGCEQVIADGGEAIPGNFLAMPVASLTRCDVVIMECVVDHQELWHPICLKALEIAPRLIIGLRRWSGTTEHSAKWRTDGNWWDNFYSQPKFEEEAIAMGLKYQWITFHNAPHKRNEVVVELTK